ncbi:hypothetical protein GQ42DRAFT_172764 [Ramicandelaber brevisporus]|nr:hypothetical protein GQ42DRAFT_172764 [Ramicandelaber brevisporus]
MASLPPSETISRRIYNVFRAILMLVATLLVVFSTTRYFDEFNRQFSPRIVMKPILGPDGKYVFDQEVYPPAYDGVDAAFAWTGYNVWWLFKVVVLLSIMAIISTQAKIVGASQCDAFSVVFPTAIGFFYVLP